MPWDRFLFPFPDRVEPAAFRCADLELVANSPAPGTGPVHEHAEPSPMAAQGSVPTGRAMVGSTRVGFEFIFGRPGEPFEQLAPGSDTLLAFARCAIPGLSR